MRTKIAFLLGAFLFIVGLLTLPDYGINWDTINHLPRGQAYLHYFLTGNKNYNDLEESPEFKWYWQNPDSLAIDTDIPREAVPKRSMYQSYAADFGHFMLHDGDGHPPLSDILSSVFNRVLFGKLRLINDIDAYRVYGVFLAALLVALLYWWTAKLYGKFAGLVSAISLALYPLFWAESHFNTEKDIPETTFWAFMLFSLWIGVTKKSWKWILVSGVFFGLGLGTKFNILFSFFVLVPWLTITLFGKYKKYLRLLPFGFLAIFVGVFIFVGSWPYLWADPMVRIGRVFGFYKGIGLSASNEVNFLAIKWIILTTPLIILTLFVIGVVAVFFRFKQEKHKTSLLFLFWFLVPIARATFPGASVYGGVRQLMEYIPAMAILAGIGANYLVAVLKRREVKVIAYLLFTISYLLLAMNLIRIHPNENVFFNNLIGGLSGAKERDIPYWGFSFGSPYRRAASFINKVAESGAKVVFVYDLIPNIPRIWLRTDLTLHNSNRSGYLQKGEYAMALVYEGTRQRSYYDAFLENFVEPVYEQKVDGVSILKVWKNSPEHLKKPLQEKLLGGVDWSKEISGIKFVAPKAVKLSRLEVEYETTDDCLDKMTSGYVEIRKEGEREILAGNLPDDWRIAALGEQPKDGRFIEPFVGQEATSVFVEVKPQNSCLYNVTDYKLYYFE